MKHEKKQYLNFPISLLQGLLDDTQGALSRIIDYCIIYETKVHLKPIDEARKMFGMAKPPDMKSWWAYATQLFYNTPRNQPRTGLEVRMFWEYYQEEKTDEEKAILLAFLAIKSILGYKTEYKLGKQEIIFHRMAGHTNTDGDLPDNIKKHCSRYKFDKIKAELQDHWGIVFYANHIRGMYISTTWNMNTLAYIAEKKKQATKQKQEAQRKRQEEARDFALKELAKPAPKII